jgi:signal peptidase I, bacterial type
MEQEKKATTTQLKIKKSMKTIFHYVIIVFIAFALAFALRVFLLASFSIPSPSMEPAIMAGDYIIVNKQIPGPRVYKNFNFKKGGKVETHRFRGIRKIKRNDVLVFNFPYIDGRIEMDLNVNYIKRCIAVPGDFFSIENGIYKVKGVTDVLGHLPHQQEVSRTPREEFRPEIWNTFPFDTSHYNWNVKYFGPLYVPGAGDTLTIDILNYRLYKNLIEYETDKQLLVRNGSVYLGDALLNHYVFQQNYYFMSGDWARDSQDSRYWGLLPEDHIIGKAVMVWQSRDINTGKRKWERAFKKIS